MINPPSIEGEWYESRSARGRRGEQTGPVFESLFERSAGAIRLFDPQAGVSVDCNSAAVELMCAGTKEKLLGARPEDLSPLLQPDGTSSRDKTTQIITL